MLRRLRAAAALAVVACALTGCMKIDAVLAIDGQNDAVNGSLIFAVDKNVLTAEGRTLEQGFATVEDELAELAKGSRSEVYDDGMFYGRRIHFDTMPFSEFNSVPGGARIVHENGRYTFTYEANATGLGDVAALPLPALDHLRRTQYRVSVTFPGEVIEHDDKASVTRRTVTWNLKIGENHRLHAVSEEPVAFSWLLFGTVVGLFGLLAVGGIVVLAVHTRRRRQPQADTTPAGF